MCPLCISGLIGPGDRKCIQPMAERLALGEYDQLHHFIAAGSGMLLRWRQNCLFQRTGSSAAATPCSTGPPSQPTLPAVRHAILELIAHHRSDVRIAENGLATSRDVSKSAKVVLALVCLDPTAAPATEIDDRRGGLRLSTLSRIRAPVANSMAVLLRQRKCRSQTGRNLTQVKREKRNRRTSASAQSCQPRATPQGNSIRPVPLQGIPGDVHLDAMPEADNHDVANAARLRRPGFVQA